MSKTEILQELPHLTAHDRREILDRLWDIEEWDVLQAGEPSAEEKSLLDEALDAYGRNPEAGRPWREVLALLEGESVHVLRVLHGRRDHRRLLRP